MQFLVPAGWGVEKNSNGMVTLTKRNGESYAVVVISLLPPASSRLTPEAQS
jgi:hypothetical protein